MIWCLIAGLALAGDRQVQVSVQDPQRQVTGDLRVAIQGSEGTNQVIHLKDDGADPDHTPRDGIFTGNAQFSDRTVHLELGTEQRKWTADAMLPDPDRDTVLRLQLGPEETAVVLQGARGMLGGPGPAGSPADGLWIWAILLGGLGVGLGLAARWGLARPPESARITGLDLAAAQPIERFKPEGLEQLLCELKDHAVIVVGESPDGLEVGRCMDTRVSISGLIQGIEAATLGSSSPPVLVITHPERIELPLRTTLVKALTRAVKGRIAVWLVEDSAGS